jgi:hypothetical protein
MLAYIPYMDPMGNYMLGKSKPANAVGHCFLAEIIDLWETMHSFHGWVFQMPTVWLIHKGYHSTIASFASKR